MAFVESIDIFRKERWMSENDVMPDEMDALFDEIIRELNKENQGWRS